MDQFGSRIFDACDKITQLLIRMNFITGINLGGNEQLCERVMEILEKELVGQHLQGITLDFWSQRPPRITVTFSSSVKLSG